MKIKKKVLQCIRQGLIGGGESHLLVLVENMDKDVFEPVVLSFTEGPMIDKLNELGIKNYVIPSKRAFDIGVWSVVKKLMIEEKIDIVHAHGSRANSNIIWAARSLNLPLIYTVHGWSFHPDQNFFIQKLRILGEKYLTSMTNVNISVSDSNRSTGKKFIKNFESVVINNGIDQRKFNPEIKYTDFKKKLNLKSDTILILFLARFTAHKQPLPLIKAFLKVLETNNNTHLLMVGDGDQKSKAIQMVTKYGINRHVTFLPFQTDVPSILASSDIYVLPSLWEGLPIGLLEAMAMGKAVIGSKVDGTREIIEDNVNGFLVDPKNLVEQLAKKIILLCEDYSRRKMFQTNAISTITENYSAITMTKKIENLYTSIIEK